MVQSSNLLASGAQQLPVALGNVLFMLLVLSNLKSKLRKV
ncbi:hypothetical protein PRUB_a2656 [Pseudoalteromonas rubra]|uniref:Uncharacterized protein n=1 Tax=Pseudoalteromonas rubra TaxID=43658 RepID=A0A8T0CDJ4_9GAMM|nr:hypothetical protein PRUB_a2656 [Pseudoalteromonas rubra]